MRFFSRPPRVGQRASAFAWNMYIYFVCTCAVAIHRECGSNCLEFDCEEFVTSLGVNGKVWGPSTDSLTTLVAQFSFSYKRFVILNLSCLQGRVSRCINDEVHNTI